MCTKTFSARRRRNPGFMTALGVSAALLFAAPAVADEPRKDGAAEEKEGAGKDDPAKKGSAKNDAPRSEVFEDPLKRYDSLGARFRDVVVPQFMLELFAAGGATGNVWLVGPELTMRKDRTEIDIVRVDADYSFGPAMLKGKDDADVTRW